MNSITQNMQDRRSVRQYTDKAVGLPLLQEIAAAGQNAPTAMNKQTRLLTVVRRQDLLSRLCEAMRKALDDKDYGMYAADAIIIVSEDRDESNAVANCACAMQNMMLAAHSLGLGSVWINQLKHVSDDPGVRAVLDALDVPASHYAWCNLALGYADGQTEPKPKDGAKIGWFL